MKKVKDISIKSFLAERGITPVSERAGYGMYNSPLRNENLPSFKVDYTKNLWYDFGLGIGGSIVDLVIKLENCTIGEAFSKLEGNAQLPIVNKHYGFESKVPTIRIERVEPLQNPHLLGYLSKRCIDINIAKHYCKEIHYSSNYKNYYSIGFANDNGGWELRNEYFKGSCIPKVPTIIKGSTDNTLLFEGFIDMLSYMSIYGKIDTVNNVCILNSVNNLSKAERFLKTQNTIHCFLDNDAAGRAVIAKMQSLGFNTIDHSNLYKDFNDLNDYLKSKIQVQKPLQRGRKIKF